MKTKQRLKPNADGTIYRFTVFVGKVLKTRDKTIKTCPDCGNGLFFTRYKTNQGE